MSGGELRDSVRLVPGEWRLFALGALGPAVYGLWVLASGLVLSSAAPSLGSGVLGRVGGTPVRGRDAFAALAWLALPTLAGLYVFNGHLFNRHDNLAHDYRMDSPGVLLVVPAVTLVGCLLALSLAGWSPALGLALVVVAVHFLARTVAYGRRVYTLSVPRTLAAITAVSSLSIVVGLFLRLPAVTARDPRLAARAAQAEVGPVVETFVAIAGIDPTPVVRGSLFVPVVLSTAYLLAQTVAATVAKRRGLPTAPDRRPGQRVPETAQPTVEPEETRVVGPSGTAAQTVVDDSASEATDDTGPGPEAHSGTRVYAPSDPVPAPDGTAEDGWVDDTEVYADTGDCPNCDREVDESVSFCPGCGTPLGG